MCFVAKNLHQPFLLSTIAQAVTLKPVALHGLGTRKVAQSRCARVQITIMHSRSKFTNGFIPVSSSLVPSPHLARRGSGDIRLIPRASLKIHSLLYA